MTHTELDNLRSRWFPVAASTDLHYRHVFWGQLLGRELAIWRADDGYVNVWENRCLHRGVRLSIGINDGAELQCQYHGWRYANRNAGCTYIPAHPADAPARTICNRVYPCREKYGLIFVGEHAQQAPDPLADFPEAQPLCLRALPVNSSLDPLYELLASYQAFADETPAGCIQLDDHTIGHRSAAGELLVFCIQPVDSDRHVIRGLISGQRDASAAERLALLRWHNQQLNELRARCETQAVQTPPPAKIKLEHEPVAAELAELPALRSHDPNAQPLRVVVQRKWATAKDIVALRLEPIEATLPTIQPGAHIDVHLPNSLSRQYSLVNAPGETDAYIIAVKRENIANGGSQCLHESVRSGDVLAVSAPHNNFNLRRDAERSLLIAGGIGVTPLLAMAQALQHSDLPYELHYFAAERAQLAFPERLAQLNCSEHLGLSPEQTRARIQSLVQSYQEHWQLYVCGPQPMLAATGDAALGAGWPEAAIHFEYFKNPNEIRRDSHFTIELARSVMSLEVTEGASILEVLREHGLRLPASCEQGACGTCVATVLEGDIDHQDVYLSAAEKARGDRILTCVSRAKSKRLILDI